MFYRHLLTGASLPPRTVSLTFDDGPGRSPDPHTGPRTLELARTLSREQICATFFLFGPSAAEHPDIVNELLALGHHIGHHCSSHIRYSGLYDASLLVRDVHGGLKAVRRGSKEVIHLYRPPYGDWSPGLAATLNNELEPAVGMLGPVGWDVSTEDWAFWRDGRSPEECCAFSLQAIESAGKGIVLMHDSNADMPEFRARNRTLELVRLLVPALRRRGYRFFPLAEVPLLKELLALPVECSLQGASGRYLALQNDRTIRESSPTADPSTRFTVLPRGEGTVALRASNGKYLTHRGLSGRVIRATGRWEWDLTRLAVESVSPGRVRFQTLRGHAMTLSGPGGVLRLAQHAGDECDNFWFRNSTILPDLWKDWTEDPSPSPSDR